jgi:hypothetical protein
MVEHTWLFEGLLGDGVTAVDSKDRAGDVPCALRRQEDRSLGDFVSRSEAAERDPGKMPAALVGLCQVLFGHRRDDVTRCDRVHAYPGGPEFDR